MLSLLLLLAVTQTEKSETGTRYVAMDSIALRDAPDAKGKKVDELALGDVVELLGERSVAELTQRLRCKDVTARWFKVKTKRSRSATADKPGPERSEDLGQGEATQKTGDKEGWVFGGALGAEKVEVPRAKWRAVVSFMTDPENASEDSAFFDEDINSACQKAKNYFAFAEPSSPCAVIGDEKKPLSVVDMSELLKTADETGKRWMLIERNGAKKTVKVLTYGLETRDEAVKFCSKK